MAEGGSVQLASIVDVGNALGRTIDVAENARVEFLISQISEKFCREARQSFRVESFTHRVKVNGCKVVLPRRPLVSVESVKDDANIDVPYSLGRGFIAVNLPSDSFVVVAYRAGFDSVPDVVRNQVADSVKRILSIDSRALAGQTQANQTAGPYSEQGTFATWAVGGQAMLSPDDIALARSLRPKRAGNVWVS